MNIYTYLVKGYRCMKWVTVNANNESDAQIKAVQTFNDCMDDIAIRVYQRKENGNMYLIIHRYDVDGGFGDAVSVEDVVGFIDTKEEAEAYVKKWSNPRIYDKPYNDLYCGELYVREVKKVDIEIDTFGDESDYEYYVQRKEFNYGNITQMSYVWTDNRN